MKKRCEQFATSVYSVLVTKGESQDTAKYVYERASAIVLTASDRTLSRSEYAAAVLEIYVLTGIGLLGSYQESDLGSKDAFASAEFRTKRWADIRMIIGELMGLAPIRTHERRREKLTEHWRSLYQHGNDQVKVEVVVAARTRYPDFDVSLLTQGDEEKA